MAASLLEEGAREEAAVGAEGLETGFEVGDLVVEGWEVVGEGFLVVA